LEDTFETKKFKKEMIKGLEENHSTKIKALKFIRTYDFGEGIFIIYDLKKENDTNNYCCIIGVTKEKQTHVASFLYNKQIFNKEFIEFIESDIHHAIFTYHIGMSIMAERDEGIPHMISNSIH
jgi:hypothetical protein